jgi:hypothetical protein
MKNLKEFRFTDGRFPKGLAEHLVVLSVQLDRISFNNMAFEDPDDETKLKNGLKCKQGWGWDDDDDEITVGCWFYNVNSFFG